MASLYEINEAITNCVDEETGEIIDIEKLNELQMEMDRKIENLGLWYKNLVSDAQAIKYEIDTLTERKRRNESKAEQIKSVLDNFLNNSKFETPKITMFYRKSKVTEVFDNFIEWTKKRKNRIRFLTYKEPTPNKTAIKEAILNGEKIPHAAIVEKNNLTIK